VNRRSCCGCTDRYPLQHEQHTLPNGGTLRCVAGPYGDVRLVADPTLPPGVVWLYQGGKFYKCLDLLFEGPSDGR
jgi:hypothetical protein